MNVVAQIDEYIASQPEQKRSDMQALHKMIAEEVIPTGRLWFLDGRDSENKVVSNPNIGYGLYTINYVDGKTKDFYQIGMSANTSGISVYILGIADKTYLARTFGETIGKANVTGYCIKFRKLTDINIDVLKTAIRHGIKASSS